MLVIIVLLALGAYTFTEMSVAENEATTMYGRSVMARGFAESGIDVAANSLADPAQREQADPTLNRPDLFSAIQLREADVARGRGRFSVITGQEHDLTGGSTRFGLTDETGKLNVNTVLPALPQVAGSERRHIRAHFLYADPEHDQRRRRCHPRLDRFGRHAAAIRGRIGLLSCLAAALSHGEYVFDEPRRLAVCPRGDAGAALRRRSQSQRDHGSGRRPQRRRLFRPGWSRYLTVYSAERNLQINGTPRVNVNQTNLPQLYQQLQGLYGDPTANFVVAYRIWGLYTGKKLTAPKATTTTLGGMAVPQTPWTKNSISSLYGLIGQTVYAMMGTAQKKVQNPWPSGLNNMAQYLPDMIDKLSLVDDPFIQGRINVNQVALRSLDGRPEHD